MNAGNNRTPWSADAGGNADAAAAGAELGWAIRSGRAEDVMRRTAARVRRRRVQALATGLGLVVMGVGSWLAWFHASPAAATTPATLIAPTVVSSIETRTLADGTVVELGRGAQMVVEYSAAKRRVTLVRGNAHFEVAKDANRPFVVAAGDIEARALGTAFAVQLSPSTVEVLVTHGTVRVDRPRASSPATDAKPPETVLQAGNRVVVGFAGGDALPLVVETVSGLEESERLAWRVPLLEFSGTPLSEVILNFNRHGRSQLIFGDDSIRGLQLSGVLRADNTELLLRLLKIEFGIQADREGDRVVLRR